MVTIFSFDHMTGENRELSTQLLKPNYLVIPHRCSTRVSSETYPFYQPFSDLPISCGERCLYDRIKKRRENSPVTEASESLFREEKGENHLAGLIKMSMS